MVIQLKLCYYRW